MKIYASLKEFASGRSLVLQILQYYVCFHILLEYIPRLYYYKDLYTPSGLSGMNESLFFESYLFFIPASFISSNAGLVCALVCCLASLVLWFGPRFWIFLCLTFGVDSLCFLNNWILDGGDNWLKFLLIYLTIYSFSTDHLSLIASKNWQIVLNDLRVLSVINIAVHFALIYLVSGLAKMNADVWHQGVAIYYILGADRFCSWSGFHDLTKIPLFSVGISYTTIIWEVAAPFLLWVKPYKYPMIAMGIMLHLGILLVMMLGGFQLLYIFTLLIYLDDHELTSALSRARKVWLSFIDKFAMRKFSPIS